MSPATTLLLDEVAALLQNRYPDKHHEVGRRDAQRDRDLNATRAAPSALA